MKVLYFNAQTFEYDIVNCHSMETAPRTIKKGCDPDEEPHKLIGEVIYFQGKHLIAVMDGKPYILCFVNVESDEVNFADVERIQGIVATDGEDE